MKWNTRKRFQETTQPSFLVGSLVTLWVLSSLSSGMDWLVPVASFNMVTLRRGLARLNIFRATRETVGANYN